MDYYTNLSEPIHSDADEPYPESCQCMRMDVHLKVKKPDVEFKFSLENTDTKSDLYFVLLIVFIVAVSFGTFVLLQ